MKKGKQKVEEGMKGEKREGVLKEKQDGGREMRWKPEDGGKGRGLRMRIKKGRRIREKRQRKEDWK